MSGNLTRDSKNIAIQGFAPTRIVAVTTAEWTPLADDRAFCVASDCTYLINDTGESGWLNSGAIRAIVPGQTYTFDTAQNIEVM